LLFGSFPKGQRPGIYRAETEVHDAALANIACVALPASDPVTGAAAPLLDCWRSGGSL
jgi:uncharacterized protein YjlB